MRAAAQIPTMFMAVLAAACLPARADTFMVTNTGNDGPGSLRQAMIDAIASQFAQGCVRQTIEFDISGAGPHRIRPISALPKVNMPIIFDGYSQPGASANTLVSGSNVVIQIEIDGSLAGPADAFVIGSAQPGVAGALCSGSTSRFTGLAINRWAGAAISMGEEGCLAGQTCSVGGVRVFGNHIGTDVTGMIALGNGGSSGRPAIVFGESSGYNIVGDQVLEDGGPQDTPGLSRNVISGNTGDAILITSPRVGTLAISNRIRNNYIGTNAQGSAVLPNGGRGVAAAVNTTNTQIHDNLIAGNAGDGVTIASSESGTTVIGNGIGIGLTGQAFGNGGNGILVTGSSRGVTIGRRFVFAQFGTAAISNNAGAGVLIENASTVDQVSTTISGNAGLEIDLAPAGVNPNDDTDPDTGPNELLNAPTLVSARVDTATQTGTIIGTLNSTPSTSGFEINYYTNDNCDASGHGGGQTRLSEGQIPISSFGITTNAQGNASFTRTTGFLPVGKYLTAFTRRFSLAPGGPALITSEFSACVQILAATDLIFANGFE